MKLSLSILMLTLISLGQANEDPYPIPITRNGTTQTMIANNFWSREYPEPVINVQPTNKKWNRIYGYASLRKLDKKKPCTIQSGLYHPWSKRSNSLINFYSILPKTDYLVQKDTTLEEQKLKKGDTLKNEIYLAEGYCSYTLNGKKRFEAVCITDKDKAFRLIKPPLGEKEQWLYLQCKEGYKVFVQDKMLLAQKNVSKGRIKFYGEVSAK